ncbi:hypothetical protein ACVW0K_007317 [Streptomyces filamentosus]
MLSPAADPSSPPAPGRGPHAAPGVRPPTGARFPNAPRTGTGRLHPPGEAAGRTRGGYRAEPGSGPAFFRRTTPSAP